MLILPAHHAFPLVVLYIGPDQIMPLTSFLGAAVGIALMFWNRLLQFARRVAMRVTRRDRTEDLATKDLNHGGLNPEKP